MHMHMEWRTFYLDVTLVPLGLLINLTYHVWLWHKVRTQPSLTIFGIDADGRRLWIPTIIKVCLLKFHTLMFRVRVSYIYMHINFFLKNFLYNGPHNLFYPILTVVYCVCMDFMEGY